MAKKLIAKIRLFLRLRVIGGISAHFVGINLPGASQVVDSYIIIRERLIDED